MQEARHQLHLDITDKHTTLELDGECYYLNNNSANIGFQVNPTRTVKGSVTPETWDSFSNYNKLRAEAEMKASKHLREAIFATLQQTANDLEAQRRATEYSFRKRIQEKNQAKSELEWQQKNVCILINACYVNLQLILGKTVHQNQTNPIVPVKSSRGESQLSHMASVIFSLSFLYIIFFYPT